jgi:hypothetical protein
LVVTGKRRLAADRSARHDPSVHRPTEAAMQLTLRTLCLLIAVVLFVIYAIDVRTGDVSLLGVGLAFFAGSFTVPDTTLSQRR